MKLQDKLVLVTGVSGTAGDRIAARCVREGAKVKGLIRKEEQVSLCNDHGITPVQGDLTNREAIKQALQGVDIVIHAAAYLGGDRDAAEQANMQGVQNLADESLSAGVGCFVHISTVSVYGHSEDEVEMDEASELAYGHSNVYVSTKCESEKIVQAAAANGLPIVILRSGVISAEYNSHWGDKLVAKIDAAEEVTWIHPDDLTPWVHAENLAEMCILAATHPAAHNQVYNAVDGNYREDEFTARIARAMDKTLKIPSGNPIRMAYRHNKIRDELGYRPIVTFEETVTHLENQARSLRRE